MGITQSDYSLKAAYLSSDVRNPLSDPISFLSTCVASNSSPLIQSSSVPAPLLFARYAISRSTVMHSARRMYPISNNDFWNCLASVEQLKSWI